MRNKVNISPSPSSKISTKRTTLIWLSYSFLLAAIISGTQMDITVGEEPVVQEFYFSPIEDNFYENPANWKPFYPGTIVNKGQKVNIQGVAYVTGYDLEVSGALEITMDGTLYSSQNDVIINNSGFINNHGEIMVRRVKNYGRLSNNIASRLSIYQYLTYAKSVTENLRSANFEVLQSVKNEGEVTNYSYFSAGEDFSNASDFYQMRGSELVIRGVRVDDLKNNGVQKTSFQ